MLMLVTCKEQAYCQVILYIPMQHASVFHCRGICRAAESCLLQDSRCSPAETAKMWKFRISMVNAKV